MSEVIKFGIDWSAVNTFYVGKHGSDSSDGKTHARAKLTIGAAISASSSGDAIVIVDQGTYPENVDLQNRIFHAPLATVAGSITIGGSNIRVRRVVAPASGIGINWPNTASVASCNVDVDEINHATVPLSSKGISVTKNNAQLILNFRKIFGSAGGTGIEIIATGAYALINGNLIDSNSGAGAVGVSIGGTAVVYQTITFIDCANGTGLLVADSVCEMRATSHVVIGADVLNVGTAGYLSIFFHTAVGNLVGIFKGSILDL